MKIEEDGQKKYSTLDAVFFCKMTQNGDIAKLLGSLITRTLFFVKVTKDNLQANTSESASTREKSVNAFFGYGWCILGIMLQ